MNKLILCLTLACCAITLSPGAISEPLERQFSFDDPVRTVGVSATNTGNPRITTLDSLDISPPESQLESSSIRIVASYDSFTGFSQVIGSRVGIVGTYEVTMSMSVSGEGVFETFELSEIGGAGSCTPYVTILGVRCGGGGGQITDRIFEFDLADYMDQESIGKVRNVTLFFTEIAVRTRSNGSMSSQAYVDGLNVIVFQEFQNAVPDSLIILTHGWQPETEQMPGVIRHGCVDSETPHSRLPELQQAIKTRLSNEIENGEVELIDCRWPEAYTGDSPGNMLAGLLQKGAALVGLDIFDDLLLVRAESATPVVGKQVADRIQLKIQSYRDKIDDQTYDPDIHFIGHSLGTLVNAHAIKNIFQDGLTDPSKRISIQQATILDSPSVDSSFFYETMPVNSVEYVENYFGRLPTFGTGTPIKTTGPCSGSICSGFGTASHGHTAIHAELYSGIVDQTDTFSFEQWVSPALENWNPPVKWNPLSVFNSIEERITYSTSEIFPFSSPSGYNAPVLISNNAWQFNHSSGGGFGLEVFVFDTEADIEFLSLSYSLEEYDTQIQDGVNTTLSVYFAPNTTQISELIYQASTDEGSLLQSGNIILPADFVVLGDLSLNAISPKITIHVNSTAIVGNVERFVDPNVIVSELQVGVNKPFIAGDLNRDNALDFLDFSNLNSAFGSCLLDTRFENNADYDADGCITFIDYQTWYDFYINQ